MFRIIPMYFLYINLYLSRFFQGNELTLYEVIIELKMERYTGNEI